MGVMHSILYAKPIAGSPTTVSGWQSAGRGSMRTGAIPDAWGAYRQAFIITPVLRKLPQKRTGKIPTPY